MRTLTSISITLSALFMIAGCVTKADTQPDRTPKVCPLLYQPVCGIKGAATANFSNPCEAKRAGYSVMAQGQCRSVDTPAGTVATVPSKACTREYRPVCASNGKIWKSFSNGCMAEASGYRVKKPGNC